MTKAKVKPYTKGVKQLMAEKSSLLSKAHALSDMGLGTTALALWTSAAEHEERLAPLLETLGRTGEAALHRISAASCFQRAGDPSRAANLFRAALAGPLPAETMREVQQMLADCLTQLTRSTIQSAG